MPYVSALIDMDDIEDDDLVKACRDRNLVVLPAGEASTSPAELSRLVENAFLASREIADLPQAVKDLFYVVHGRAMP